MNKEPSYALEFRDNQKLAILVGPEEYQLRYLEDRLDVSLVLNGNRIFVFGEEPFAGRARAVLEALYKHVSTGLDITTEVLEEKILWSSYSLELVVPDQHSAIQTKRRLVTPRTPRQAEYIRSIQTKDMVFGIGPAGTGKTYLAVTMAVSFLLAGRVDRIILSRPAVEAGERLGFLPGDMKDKVDPYLRPLYDALHDLLPSEQVAKRLANGDIEIAPLAFMRGRTLTRSFVILDEAQNTTPVQMRMFLTRLGHDSKMVITGDLTQVDLPPKTLSGLQDAYDVLNGVPEIAFIQFDETDVVRHSLVSKIVVAYDQAYSRSS